MIGKIKGLIEEKSTNQLLVDVGGLVYELDIPLTTSFSLPGIGQPVTLFTHFVVREDAQLLYGFLHRQDRDMFRVLIKVNGVGPKMGIAILSGLTGQALARCVESEDVTTLVKLPGIGKKTAERLLIELRDKVKLLLPVDAGTGNVDEGQHVSSGVSMLEEAESALIALGYRPQDAAKAIKINNKEGLTLEGLIKRSLKSMM